MGGKFSNISGKQSIGLLGRIKSIFKHQKQKNDKYRIKKKNLRLMIEFGKLGLISLFIYSLNLNYWRDLKVLNSKYDNIIERLNASKTNLDKLNENYENFYKLLSTKFNYSSQLLSYKMVQLNENDKSFIFFEELIDHFLKSSNVPNNDLKLHIIKYIKIVYSENIINEVNLKETDQFYFGFSTMGGNVGLLENLVRLKKNSAELFFIVALNLTHAFFAEFPKKLRNHIIDNFIHIANLDRKEKKNLEEIETILEEIEKDNSIIYNFPYSLVFKEKYFLSFVNGIDLNLMKFNIEVYSEIINKTFELYVNAGFDPNELLTFSFEKLPLNYFNKAEFSVERNEILSKLQKILKKNIIHHQKKNSNFTKSEEALRFEKRQKLISIIKN